MVLSETWHHHTDHAERKARQRQDHINRPAYPTNLGRLRRAPIAIAILARRSRIVHGRLLNVREIEVVKEDVSFRTPPLPQTSASADRRARLMPVSS